MAHVTPPGPPLEATTRGFLGVFRYSRRAIELVWATNAPLTVVLAVLTLIAGVLPAAMAYVGALIIDAVLAATKIAQDSGDINLTRVFTLVAIEALIRRFSHLRLVENEVRFKESWVIRGVERLLLQW